MNENWCRISLCILLRVGCTSKLPERGKLWRGLNEYRSVALHKQVNPGVIRLPSVDGYGRWNNLDLSLRASRDVSRKV